MKLIAAFFSLFFLYFLHCAEAKADTFYSADQHAPCRQLDQRFDGALPAFSKYSGSGLQANKWAPGPYILSEEIHIAVSEVFFLKISKLFHANGARDFVIRTGLSPPNRFA